MADEAIWKRRFHLFAAARLFGLATFLAGMAVMFTDILRDGGWPVVGAILMVMGLLDAVVAPKLMKKQWQREDESE
ncbi:MAG TPA: hypothetical protein VFO51_04990 [Sphingomicrobium sp.]|nr:hypothetical protein [Sphingomicrobium sp.]